MLRGLPEDQAVSSPLCFGKFLHATSQSFLVCCLTSEHPVTPVGKQAWQSRRGFDSWPPGAQGSWGSLGAVWDRNSKHGPWPCPLAWPQHGDSCEMERQQARLEPFDLSEMDEARHCVGGKLRLRAYMNARLLWLLIAH